MIAARKPFGHRSGLTLMELIIVVVILAVAASLTVPLVQQSFSAQRVEKAGNLVRAGMNKARIKAMQSGDVFGFYYFPQSRDFRVAPFNNDVVQHFRSRRQQEIISGSNFDFGEDQLPQGIIFLDGDVMADARSEQEMQDNSISERNVKPVLFYPDGSSQSAKIMLRCDDDYAQINLRGMTGTSRMVPVNESQLPRR